MDLVSEYKENFLVCRHDGDCNGKLKPGALLRYAQQIATDQCNALGMDRAFYERTHTAFLLAKQELRFLRVPDVDEVLTFHTIPEESRRAVNRRVTKVYDASGALAAAVDSRWVLVDTNTRSIIRRPGPEFAGKWLKNVDFSYPVRLESAASLTPAGQAAATYSLCDLNGHLNNTRYADIVCDLLPVQQLRQRPVGAMVLVYHREVPLGQKMNLLLGQTQSGWYVKGERQGAPAFEASVTLAESP